MIWYFLRIRKYLLKDGIRLVCFSYLFHFYVIVPWEQKLWWLCMTLLLEEMVSSLWNYLGFPLFLCTTLFHTSFVPKSQSCRYDVQNRAIGVLSARVLWAYKTGKKFEQENISDADFPTHWNPVGIFSFGLHDSLTAYYASMFLCHRWMKLLKAFHISAKKQASSNREKTYTNF